MNQERPYWNMEMEPLLNTPEMETIQLEKLRKMLVRMKANAPFYSKMFAEAGLDPENMIGFDEYKDKIKPFDKAALRQKPFYHGISRRITDRIMEWIRF